MRDGGKGDRKRPLVISEEKFSDNWDKIFKTREQLQKVKRIQIPCPDGNPNCLVYHFIDVFED
jgi:hypothetical protein